VLKKLSSEYAGKGVFVRSSSNSEDLPNFSGAGLYTSVPNVREPEKVIEAIKTVWASLWNYEAYEARERKLVKHTDIYMGVLIQEGVNSESSGVIITSDPFNDKNNQFVYIAAKRGLGTRVVEGQRVAEQILYNPKTKVVRILTRSEEDSLVTFDENGGVKEIPIAGNREVLTDEVARRLAVVAIQIEKIFGGKTQDIEWAVMKGQIYIVQSRPFVTKS
jgi:phosphoenolpyruvate synthase/pyruvate phosphate dikinase